MRFKIIIKVENGKVLEEFVAEGHSELIRLTWISTNIKSLYNCKVIYKEIRYVNGMLTEVDSTYNLLAETYSKLV